MGPQEKIYDEQIAPELMKLAKICEDHKIGFIAIAEYDPSQLSQATTVVIPKGSSASMNIIYMLARSIGNFDKFYFSLIKYLKDNKLDHNSIILNQDIEPLASERKLK